jgi:hypothetical protein
MNGVLIYQLLAGPNGAKQLNSHANLVGVANKLVGFPAFFT